LKKQQHSIS